MTHSPEQPERLRTCSYCEAALAPTARKCRHCGEWVDRAEESEHPIVPQTQVPIERVTVIDRGDEPLDMTQNPKGQTGSPQQINVGQPMHHSQHVHLSPPSGPAPGQPAGHGGPTVQVNVNAPSLAPVMAPGYLQRPSESPVFAIITLILYILLVTWPVAAILNIIGLFTGPKRGCFVAMFFVCFCGGCLTGIAYGVIRILMEQQGSGFAF